MDEEIPINTMTFKIEKKRIVPQNRKLAAGWTLETGKSREDHIKELEHLSEEEQLVQILQHEDKWRDSQDIVNLPSIDQKAEIVKAMAKDIMNDIDNEIIKSMIQCVDVENG